MQDRFNFFAQQKLGLAGEVAHFDEVQQGELGNGVCIGLALGFKSGKKRPWFLTEGVHHAVQLEAVLEPGIHSLSIEGNNGVRSVSKEDHLALGPGPAAHNREFA